MAAAAFVSFLLLRMVPSTKRLPLRRTAEESKITAFFKTPNDGTRSNQEATSPDHATSGKRQYTLKEHYYSIDSVDLSAAGTYLTVSSADGFVSLWKHYWTTCMCCNLFPPPQPTLILPPLFGILFNFFR